MDLKKTGRLIAQQRKEKNLTQKELASLLGVTDKAISRWETGKGFPDVAILEILSQTLNVSIAEIVNGDRIVPEQAESDHNRAVLAALSYSRRMRRTFAIVLLCILGILLIASPLYVLGSNNGICVVLGLASLLTAVVLFFVKKAPTEKISRRASLFLLLFSLILEMIPGSAVLIFATPENRFTEYFSCFDLTIVGYANAAPFAAAILTVVSAVLSVIIAFGRGRKLKNAAYIVTILAAMFMLLPPVFFGFSYLTPLGLAIILMLGLSAWLQACANGSTTE